MVFISVFVFLFFMTAVGGWGLLVLGCKWHLHSGKCGVIRDIEDNGPDMTQVRHRMRLLLLVLILIEC